LGSSVLLLRKILLEVLLYKDFVVSRSAAECVLGRKNGRKSGLLEICGGQWRLLLGSAETAALSKSFRKATEDARTQTINGLALTCTGLRGLTLIALPHVGRCVNGEEVAWLTGRTRTD
jgi:hypothetical protein